MRAFVTNDDKRPICLLPFNNCQQTEGDYTPFTDLCAYIFIT
jgi:hypothetical protein